jgi:hypothetical protein
VAAMLAGMAAFEWLAGARPVAPPATPPRAGAA